jgi:cell division septation protein DedD
VSATADLYRAAIGKVSTDFYQRVFQRFEASERTGPTWNWAAALLTVNWMVFRQLWAAALIYGGVMVAALIAVLGLGRLVFHWSSSLEIGLLALLALLSVVVPGAFGNALLHAASRKKMAQALATNTTVPEACAMLEKLASSKQRLIWIALANAALVGATVGISIALPDADRLPLTTTATEPTRAVATAPITVASVPEMPASAPVATPTPTPAPMQAASAIAPASAAAPLPSASATTSPALSAAAEPIPIPLPAPLPALPKPASVEKPLTPEKPQASPKSSSTKPISSDSTAAKKIYINVGLFAKASNAHNAQEKLTKAGLPAKEQQVTGAKGTFTRVRVGPFKTIAQAEKAAEKIKGQGLEAVVVRQ